MYTTLKLNKNSNDEQDYEQLIYGLHTSLYSFIYTIVRNKTIAEDVFQETIYQGYKDFQRLRDSTKFKSWIYTIGRRESMKILKKHSREIIIDYDNYDYIYDASPYVEERFEYSEELIIELREIISSLTEESRNIIYLIYYSKLSMEKISSILNINCNTLKSKHKRIKEKIYRKLLEQDLR